MTIALRTRVATIVQAQGPAANPHQVIVSRELVPMREEMFVGETALDSPAKVAGALHRIQRHMNETTQAARSLPFLGGAYWPNVAFKANTATTMAHGITGGVDVAWAMFSPRPAGANAAAVVAPAVVEVSQSAPTGRITLSANLSGSYDLYFFARPGALK